MSYGVAAPSAWLPLIVMPGMRPILELSEMTVSSILGSRNTWKCPVPIGANCPSITFSEIPRQSSSSPVAAASSKISTVSSKEHRINAPVSALLIP